ncbi:MAG: NTE family protein [Cellvibrionaceae bacterium]|jgi:NTE family protein
MGRTLFNEASAAEAILLSTEGFPPIEKEGEWYWESSLVSNTPLQYVIDQEDTEDMLGFQLDLFSAEGSMPKNNLEVGRRVKDIRHSSRTRLNTDIVCETRAVRKLISQLLEKLPDALLNPNDYKLLSQ